MVERKHIALATIITLAVIGGLLLNEKMTGAGAPPITGGWCYQEFANVSTACGGLATGSYYVLPTGWASPAPGINAIDGNWGTRASSNCESPYTAYFLENYSKPTMAKNTSVWQVVNYTSSISVKINLTIPASCWAQSPLQFKGESWCFTGAYERWYCWNSSSWILLAQGANGYDYLNESAMWWDIEGNIVQVSSCQNLNQSNYYYNLTAGLTCNMNITADNITLDGNGKQLNGTLKATGQAPFVYNLAIDPTVGLLINGSSDGVYENLTIVNTTVYGIWVTNNSHRNTFRNFSINAAGGHGIYLDSGKNNSFDCNGYSIIGNNSSSTYGIYTTQFNTTVKNCNVSNFTHGVFFDDADNGTIQNVTTSSTQNSGTGIALRTSAQGNSIVGSTGTVSGTYSYGIELFNGANYNSIINSTGISTSTNVTAYSLGIMTNSVAYITIVNSTGISVTNDGLYLLSTSHSTITNSTGLSTSGGGIWLVFATNNSVVSSKGISDSDAGIYIYGNAANTHDNQIKNSNGTSNSSSGILVQGGILQNISNSIGFSNTGYGIRFSSSHNNTVDSSQGISNYSTGIRLGGSSNNNLTNSKGINVFSNESGHGVFVTGGSNSNYFSSVNASSNSSDSFYLNTSADNVINLAYVNGTINVVSSNGTIVKNTRTVRPAGVGFISNTSIDGLYENLTIVNTTIYGIWMMNNSHRNVFRNNTVNGYGTAISVASNSENNSFYRNNITAPIWINNSNATNTFNDSTSGNIYYLANYSCFQDSATTANSCGGLATGGYAIAGDYWSDTQYLNDSDFGTFGYSQSDGYYYENYSKPSAAAMSGSTVKYRTPAGTYNIQIPSACWAQSQLQFRVYFMGPPFNTFVSCWNGTTWYDLSYDGSGWDFYEMAMNWSMSSVPSWDVYNITDTNGDNWADIGSDLPFNATTVGGNWVGLGGDWHPWTDRLGGQMAVYIWNGTNWTTFNSTSSLNFRCTNPFPTICQPQNQSNETGQPILRVQNTGTSTSTWQSIATNATWATAQLLCTNSTSPTGAISVLTSAQNCTNMNLAGGQNASWYMFFNITSVPSGFARYFNLTMDIG